MLSQSCEESIENTYTPAAFLLAGNKDDNENWWPVMEVMMMIRVIATLMLINVKQEKH